MKRVPAPVQVFVLFALALYLTATAYVFDARGEFVPTAAATAGSYLLAWLIIRTSRHA